MSMNLNDLLLPVKAVAVVSTMIVLAGCTRNSPSNAPNSANRPVVVSSNVNTPVSPTPDLDRSRSDYTNPIGMMFMKIGPGTFQMGAPDGERDRLKDEGPVHPVTIGYSLLMGKFEVTQEEYEKVMGSNPSDQDLDPKNPVENVDWDQAKAFVKKLSGMDPKYKYRLPSEAEWEFGCRAGTTTVFAFGDQLGSDQANFDGTSPYGSAPVGPYRKKAVRVGSFRPNAWGLYDMHGNAGEWVEDYYREDYTSTPTDGAAVTTKATFNARIKRGGMYLTGGRHVRCASRHASNGEVSAGVGFRVVAIAK